MYGGLPDQFLMSLLSYESESVGNGFYLGNSPLKKGTLSYETIRSFAMFYLYKTKEY